MRTILFIAIILFLFSVIFARADVHVTLPDTTAYPGKTIRVPIRVSDVTGLEVFAYQFTMEYNSTVVKPIGVDSAGTLTQNWGPAGVNLRNVGKIIAGNYDVNPLQGSGVLIYVKFQIISHIADSTRLLFNHFELNAGKPPVKTSPGTIKILLPPVAVSFKANVPARLQILIDGVARTLPYDTSWIYGVNHKIGVNTPQYQTPDIRYTFQSWSDGGDTVHSVAPISDTIFVLNMAQELKLSLESKFGTPKGGGWYSKGTTAIFSVDSLVQHGDSVRYVFQSWSGVGNSSYTGPQRVKSIVMNDPVIETAIWGTQFWLKIKSSYGNAAGQGWHNQGDTVRIGIDSLVSLVAGTRYRFDAWIGTGNGSYNGSQRQPRVIMLAPITERAVWQTEHYLWLKTKPPGLEQYKNSGWYKKNKTVLTDTAKKFLSDHNYFYLFQNWSIDDKFNPANPASVLMDTSRVAEAIYRIDSVLVSIRTNIGSGTIFIDDVRYAAPYSKFWKWQSEHTVGISQVQYGNSRMVRYLFESWSDAGARIHTIKADSSLDLIAFLTTEFFLSVETYPTDLINFSEATWYQKNDTVTLSKAPAQIIAGQDTFHFKGWLVDHRPIPGNPIQIVMDSFHSAIAVYKDMYFIKGKVADRRNNPVSDVDVVLSGTLSDSIRITTGGDYQFNFLPEGNYQVIPHGNGVRFEPPIREYKLLRDNQSDQNFVAIDTLKPQISLIYPNGGERLKGAISDTIRWRANDNWGIGSVLIDLSLNGGTTWHRIVQLGVINISKYIWNIPDTTSSGGKIRIIVSDFDGNWSEDVSDSTFTIYSKSLVPDPLTDNLPQNFQVCQNYPNPFNNATIIPFQISDACHVTVRIFNVLGQEIITLVNKKLNPGRYLIPWDGKDRTGKIVSSGVYIYQVEALNNIGLKKLLMLQ